MNPSIIDIQKGTISELEDIVQFQMAMAQESEGTILDLKTVHSGVEAAMKDPSLGEYFVAKNECGTVMGSLMITKEWSDWNNSHYWWIQSVYVRPEFRGNGVFTALYQEVRRLARESGSTCLRLYVDNENIRAQSTYRRLGMDQSHYLMFEEDL